ncbi:hypothetical protein MD484_g1306, partial [Candolleomyces efflorescens]
MELKLDRNYDTVYQSRQRLISAIVHIMNDDVRRIFMFGITVEETRMTLWYFSRSHSMKAKSFDFTTDRSMLVQVLISLMFAEDKDLGFDPNIALASHISRQFIYSVNSESGPRRFKTTHSIFEHRALSVAGRMTRVFRVVELEGQTNEPKKGVKPMVLKDVWLDEGSETEMEIQKKLFADIEKFAEQPKWREAPSLAGFVDEEYAGDMSAFAELLQGERYKDLFLVVRDGSTGEASKPLPPSAWTPTSKLFYSVADASQTSAPVLRPQSQINDGIYRDNASKRRSFLLFDDECTRVYCLPKTRDVFAVLRDCIIALRLMLCAGWVHRDISCNNIMAIKDSQTGRWKLRLADLEYSKKFSFNASASDPKTGTPFFMPCEILQRRYFGHDELGSLNIRRAKVRLRKPRASPPPRIPVLHNYLHDLEATYWTGLWIITSRINHEPSSTWGLKVFRDTLTLLPDRLDAFMESILHALEECLVEDLREIAEIFDDARTALYACAKELGKRKAWKTDEGLEIHSVAHAHFAVLFSALADQEALWGTVDLEQSTSSSPRCMEAVNEDSGKPQVAPSAVQEAKDGTVQQQSNKDAKKKTKGKRKERLARRVKPKHTDEKAGQSLRRKRSHGDGEEAYEDEGDRRTGHSKRVKSNSGGRASGSAPSGALICARRTRSAWKMKAQD